MRSENLSSKEEVMKDQAEIVAEEDMGRKGSLIGLSGTWIRHLTGRFFMLPVIEFLGLFLFLSLPVILASNDPDFITDYMRLNVNGHNVAILAMMSYLVIAASALTFDYLHNTDSVTEIHAMPVTRGRLFRSTLFSGFTLLIVPLLLGAVMMILTGKLVGTDPVISQIYSPVNALRWLLDTLLYTTFSYAVATLAGVIAGSVLMHVLLSFVLEGLPTSILFMVYALRGAFIFGCGDDDMLNWMKYLSPAGYLVSRSGPVTFDEVPMYVLFGGITLVLLILSGILYKKTKFERERSTTVFPLVGDILVMVFSFILMSGFGMVFAAILGLGSSAGDEILPKNTFIISAGIGGIIIYIVMRMIGDGTVKIFTFKNLLKFLVFAGLSAAIFAVTVYDITGIANKVPKVSELSKAEVTIEVPYDQTYTLSNKDSLKALTELHKELTGTKDLVADAMNKEDGTCLVTIKYYPENGLPYSRKYTIYNIDKNPWKQCLKDVTKVTRTKEYKAAEEYRLQRIIANASYINFEAEGTSFEIPRELHEEFMENYLKDFKEMSIAEQLRFQSSVEDFIKKGTAHIFIETNYSENYGFFEPTNSSSFSLPFKKTFKNTVRFLKDNDYWNEIVEMAEEAAGDDI